MKIAHLGDLHYCERYFKEVDRCTSYAVDRIISSDCDICVVPGDLYDSSVTVHSKAHLALSAHLHRLSKHMPIVIMTGTRIHDIPGSITPLRFASSNHEILVVTSIQSHMVLDKNKNKLSINFLPPINKGQLAAVFGSEKSAIMAGEQVFNLIQGWSKYNLKLREEGTPTIVMAHGTVAYSKTEHGVPMSGNDWELTEASLFAAETSAVMLNHIHAHQAFISPDGKRKAAYAGSIGCLHYGEKFQKGFLIWEVQPDSSTFEFIETPAKKLIELEFNEAPDMDELKKAAEDCGDADVRIRYSIDEDKRHSVDKDAIKEMFKNANKVKIEAPVNHTVRIRAAGITNKVSLEDKLIKWCEVTGNDPTPLVERCGLIQAESVKDIVDNIIGSTG